jgi:predicted nucleic acid-binding protein
MRLLLDTNIFLEILLDQERASEARQLLSAVDKHHLYISDFSLHSIGLVLFRHNRYDVFQHAVAGRYMLTVVSFDQDFDRTDKQRHLPGQIV